MFTAVSGSPLHISTVVDVMPITPSCMTVEKYAR